MASSCRNWGLRGNCQYGSRCRFLHVLAGAKRIESTTELDEANKKIRELEEELKKEKAISKQVQESLLLQDFKLAALKLDLENEMNEKKELMLALEMMKCSTCKFEDEEECLRYKLEMEFIYKLIDDYSESKIAERQFLPTPRKSRICTCRYKNYKLKKMSTCKKSDNILVDSLLPCGMRSFEFGANTR